MPPIRIILGFKRLKSSVNIPFDGPLSRNNKNIYDALFLSK